jgi:hypothetical protein
MDLSRFEMRTQDREVVDVCQVRDAANSAWMNTDTLCIPAPSSFSSSGCSSCLQIVRDAVCWSAAAAEKKAVALHIQLPMENAEVGSVIDNNGSEVQQPHHHRRSFDLATAPTTRSIFVATSQETAREMEALSPSDRNRRRQLAVALKEEDEGKADARHRPVCMTADPVGLKRVFINLIDNV